MSESRQEAWNLIEILKALIGLELLCRDLWVVYNSSVMVGNEELQGVRVCCSKVYRGATRIRHTMCNTHSITL
jgi:hypothetical protein